MFSFVILFLAILVLCGLNKEIKDLQERVSCLENKNRKDRW
jgi:predicted Holliday junction resolvase-like endonuclease